jgi:hypothetical protein
MVRHLPYVKSYLVKRPGMKRGTRLVDYAALCAYVRDGGAE